MSILHKDGKYMLRRLKILWLLTASSAKIAFDSRFGVLLFLIGKVLRFGFFILFLLLLLTRTKAIAGYSFWEVLLVYLTFNFIDNTAQLLFRNVYRFRSEIEQGNFDYSLLRPFPPLVYALLGGIDPLDLPMFVILLAGIIFCMQHIGNLSLVSIFGYVALTINGIFIAMAFHIFVLSMGILTTAIDNTIMLYRDITQMGRLPVDIYKNPLRGLITFVIPVGIMMTFPVKILTGLLSFSLIVLAFGIGIVFFTLSLLCWRYAVRQYASASS